MTLALLPVTALAGWRAEVYVGGICLSLSDEDDKAYAVVDSAGTVTTDGASESNYDVKFEAVRDPDTYESVATLTLNDFHYTGSGICLPYDMYYSIYTEHDINIVLIGNNTAANLGAESANGSYGIFCGGKLTISGNGSLTAAGSHSITTSHSVESIGIYVGYDLTIESGTITATGGNIPYAEGNGSIGICAGGNVAIQAGTVNATGGTSGELSAGFYCSGGDLIISGSSTLTANGGAARGSYGLKVDSNGIDGGNLIIEGGTITATGGDLVIEAENYSTGIYAAVSVTINNGIVKATGGIANEGSYGINFSPTGTLTYQNGVMIAKSAESASQAKALDIAPSLPNKYVWRTSENTNYTRLWSNGYNTFGTAYSYNEELPDTYLEFRRVAVYPASFDFGSAVEEYNAPDSQLFWVYNCSDGDIAVDMRQLPNQNDPDSGENEYSSGYDFSATLPWRFSSGGYGTCGICPKTGLAAGTYNEEITVSDSNGTVASTTVTFTVNAAPTYTISASPETLSFGSIFTGYSQPDTQVITITNTGNQSITLTQPTATNYDIGTLSTKVLAANGDTASFTVRPKVGLAAGTYTETVTVLGTESASASTEVTVTVDKITGTVTNISDISKIYDGIAISDPTYTATGTGSATIIYKVKDADDITYTTARPLNVGNYTVRVSVAEDDNYTAASATKDFAITFLTSPANPFTLSPAANEDGWNNSDVTIRAASGYDIGTVLNGGYKGSFTITSSETDYKVYLQNSLGQMTDAIMVGDVKIDKYSPENVTVTYQDNGWKEFLNSITFGLFFKDTVEVKLTATDNKSGVKEFRYTLDGTEYTVAASSGEASFSINPQYKGNISGIKAIDYAGNVSEELATEYFAVDSQNPAAPTINLNGYTSDTWTNSDVKITLSGASATSGIAKYQYSTDNGTNWIDLTATEETTATATEPYNAVKAELIISSETDSDSYIFRAVSNAGNIGEKSDAIKVKIDKTAPTLAVTGDTSGYKQSDSVTVTPTTGISDIAKIEVKKDDGDYANITSSYTSGYSIKGNGTYTFRVTNGAGVTATDSITYANIDTAKPVISINSNGYNEGSWKNNGDITLNVSNATANLGTTDIEYKVGNGSWQDYTAPIVISQDTASTTYTFKATSASGVVSDEKTFTIKRDTEIPDGDIIIKENSVKKLINAISFGLFFKEDVDITISSTDVTSGVESLKYYRSDRILTQDELNAVSTWEDYSGTISETAADTEKFVYYIKITDNAGNVALFASDGVTFDTSAPVISGIEDGKAYKPETQVTVSDATEVTVTLNGSFVTLNNNKFNLTSQTGSVTVEATDAAGNKATLVITVNEEGLLIDTENNPDGSVTVTKTNNDGKIVEILVTYSDGSTDQTLNNIDGSSVVTKKDSSGKVTETTVTQADGSSVKAENKPDGTVVETKKDSSGKVAETTVTQPDGSSVKTENKPDGSTVETKKHSSGSVTETTVTQPDGSSVKTENKSDGSVVETKKDSSGKVTETTVTQADGNSVKTENKSDGSVVETKKDSSGNVTEMTVTQPDGSSSKTENKLDGSVVETKKDISGNVTETTVTQPDGSSVKTENKSDGSTVETKKDSSGKVTETTVIQADGSSVKTENKSDGSTIVTKTDKDGEISEATVIAADGSKIVTAYNKNGEATVTKYAPNGEVINNQGSENTSSPDTGDNFNLMLWIALLFVSSVLTTLGLIGKRRKEEYSN